MKPTPDTQQMSFESLKPKLSARRQEVYDCIESSENGMTNFEIKDKLGWEINCVSGRCTELSDGKFPRIVDSGERRKNPKSGKSGIVWRAV